MAYQPNIPTGSVPLNQDYLNIQGNFISLNTAFSIDHEPLTTATTPPSGYHTFVHLVPFSTTTSNPPNNQPVTAPAATAGFGQLFGAQINDGQNTDQSLYYLSGGNRLTQLTRNIQPSSASPGYTFLPGGLLLQWGNSTADGAGNITFPLSFTTGTFNPVVTFAPANGAAITLIVSSSKTGFVINRPSVGVSWMAIGQ